MKTSLVTRNVRIEGRRTSVRLEPPLWRSLEMIAAREETDVNALCTEVEKRRGPEGGFTSALRVFIVDYLRSLAFPEPRRAVAGVAKARPAGKIAAKPVGKTAAKPPAMKPAPSKAPVDKAAETKASRRSGSALEPAMAANAAGKKTAKQTETADAKKTGRAKRVKRDRSREAI